MLSIELAQQPVALELGPASVQLSRGDTPVTVELVTNQGEVTLEVSRPVLEFTAGAVAVLLAQAVTMEISTAGSQGSPGPSQIYDQASAPSPIASYTLLWFQSGVSADPDDREINLVVSP